MQQARKNQFYIQPPASSKLSRFLTFYRRISQILRAHNMLTMFIFSTGKIPKWSVKRKHLAREMSVYQNQDIYQLSETSLFTVKKKWWKSPLNHIPVPKMHTLIHRRDILLFPCSIFADSSRQVENWELMWVAQQVCDTDDLHYWLLTCE